MRKSTVAALVLAVLGQGCAWFGDGDIDRGPTLAELEPAQLPDPEIKIPKVTLEDIENSYRGALEVAEDPEVRRKILVRLAGLEMARSEQTQLAATEVRRFFDGAIDMYEELIELQEAHTDTDTLRYQLAKAYALDGRVEESAAVLDKLAADYPQSSLIAEAQFRRAERFFSEGNYAAAEAAYAAVMAVGEESPFYHNALYMHGWSQFKRNNYRASLGSFTKVLDAITPPNGDFASLDGPQRSLSEDTLRVMSLVFSYLDGAQTITEVYRQLGERPYHHQLYDRLGKLYLDKRRFRDSADTFIHYVKNYPVSDYSPAFSVRTIKVYELGNFPSLILPAKEAFVRGYGIHSQYWGMKEEPIRNELRTYLHVYIPELAKYYHAEAQQLKQAPKAKQKAADDAQEKGLSPAQRLAKQRQTYLTAAGWYQEFVDTFPKDKQTPEMVFLMAETFYEARQLPRAIDAYERVAYHYLDKKHGPEAGYSAILAAQELIEQAPAETRQVWAQRKIDNALNFADYYATDKRAPGVLTQAAQALLEQGEHEKAVAAARRITEWQPPAATELRRTAWLVQGHGLFDLQRYAEAEVAYRSVLQLLNPKDPDRAKIEERVAASIFKTAEQSLAAGNKAQAVEQLLRVRAATPGSEIAIKAQYDAANYLMELQRWDEAERELTDFRARFPGHSLSAKIPAKLVVVYQAMQSWELAADTLGGVAKSDPDPNVRRQSLFLAAELYEKGERRGDAIAQYRQYANTYPEPFDIAMEAKFKLQELYLADKQPGKRRFWLRKIVDGDARAGAKRTDRSRYMAAFSSTELAHDTYQNFVRIPLKLPLQRSLKNKKKALQDTLAAYKKILDYGVAEFATQANFRIGEVYSRLSSDLMDSERPKDLDALALEQYEVLLEEQAFPFEEKAIEIHEANAQRSWTGLYDDWVKQSFESLARLLPGRYQKSETVVKYSETIY
ncbi:tetratricopeptide repeat protein [Exilibacterium tricleocarpae]|uniref:Tetratricopeptide repeat protein n=1 Tax=Exilibacterium tricleocarpae TaxID=2591008 RepID=A0A545TZU7_9GAMM|nr:tetratricopeptide repeat protein [Exilibacterium tricleocarpae]